MIKILKKILCVLVLAAFGLNADAELIVPEEGVGSFASMVVNLADGTQTQINLSPQLKATFDGDDLVVTTDTEDYRFPLEGITDWFYHTSLKNEVSSNTGMTVPSGNIRIEGRSLAVSGFSAGSRVEVYSLGGDLVCSVQAADGAVVSLEEHPAGVYVVKIDDQDFKIVLK